jgi:uncharacterized protein (DUF362 family)
MTPPSNGTARVSIARLASYEPSAVREKLLELLHPLGGIEAFVPREAGVVLKPNFLRPARAERAITTHPEIIRAVGALACRAGAGAVTVTDSPGIGTAERCARRLGLGQEEAPFSVKNADDGEDFAAKGNHFHRLKLSRRMLQAEVLINLPKVKTHGQMVITGAVKNSFGAVVGMEKVQWHLRVGRDPMDFARLIVHVHQALSPPCWHGSWGWTR